MTESKQPVQAGTPAARKSTPFKQMTRRQKVVFVAKLAISILSFGFLYPNIMTD